MTVELWVRAAGLTLFITAASFALAAVLALAVVAARRSSNPLLRALAVAWINLLRGVPPLVWLFIVFFGITIQGAKFTPVSAAILTFGVVGSAYIAEAYRSGLDSLPTQQREALDALAMPRLKALRLVILPQALPVIVATCGSYAIHLLKDTALASLIGVQEMTYLANDGVHRGQDGLVTFGLLGIAYLVLSVPLAMLARAVESRGTSRRLVAGR